MKAHCCSPQFLTMQVYNNIKDDAELEKEDVPSPARLDRWFVRFHLIDCMAMQQCQALMNMDPSCG